MRILIIHQNFPGQYKHLGPALVAQGHQVVALTPKVTKPATWNGIRLLPYKMIRGSSRDIHPWVSDLETKVIRGESCYRAAVKLREQGFEPDVILAHHGWGEPMFLKDVWPTARLGLYCELYHLADKDHINFDPEFASKTPSEDRLRLRLKNMNNHLHFSGAEAGLSPTEFQASTFPEPFRSKITVQHDGVDTSTLVANPNARLKVSDTLTLSREDEVVTFINRNLEPYRGYHIFMRALPKLLKRRPNAHVVLLGGDDVSYGARPPKGKTWKQIFFDEVKDQITDQDWARVHFMGRVPYNVFLDMVQVSRAHVYLTYPFVLSWSLLEFMSAQGAIVASNTAPVCEAITDGETGVLVDFFDKDALVDRVDEVLGDSNLRQRLGAAARAHVVEKYDLKSVCLPRHLEWVTQVSKLDLIDQGV
jgi:glycosyltransferase involved in cell wall biosynthesis